VYFEGCRKLLQSFRKIEDDVQRLGSKVLGRVRVAAIYSVGLLQMNAYVQRFTQLYPDVRLRLEYLHPDEVYSRILNDEADIGLVSFPRDGGDIRSIPWQEQQMVLVVPPEHPLARRTSVPPRELDDADFVAFTPELEIRKRIDRWFRHEGIGVNVVHEFDNIENIKRAVEIGSGVALLPIDTVRREMDFGSLRAVSLTGVEWVRPLGIVHRRPNAFPTAVAKFVELLHENSQVVHKKNGKSPPINGRRAAKPVKA
jgi:DNA-binding transcriptional LysR family regulator